MRSCNFEQKFRCDNAEAVIQICKANRYRFHSRIDQEDTYLDSKEGKLKIRIIDRRDAELVFYLRPDGKAPRKSNYFRVPLGIEKNELIAILKSAIGVIGRVKKERTVYYNKNVRINIDRVKDLGEFVELEAEIKSGIWIDRSLRLVRDTRVTLGLLGKNALKYSYIDLLSARKK